MNARIHSPLRRTAAAGCALAIGLLLALPAPAQPYGRMDPDQRERLRSELRKHDAQRGDRARGESARSDSARDDSRRRASPSRERLSPAERERLREQLRDARPPESRRRGSRRD